MPSEKSCRAFSLRYISFVNLTELRASAWVGNARGALSQLGSLASVSNHRTPRMEVRMASELIFAVFGLSGVAAGFFAGLFGIGGGLIMVPVLVYAFTTTGIATQQAVAMSL